MRLRLREETFVPHSPARVFAVLSRAGEFSEWWPADLAVRMARPESATALGDFEVRPRIGHPFRCRIEEAEAPSLVRLRFLSGALQGAAVLTLAEVEGGTQVRYALDAFPRGLDIAVVDAIHPVERTHAAGMRAVLRALAQRLAVTESVGSELRAGRAAAWTETLQRRRTRRAAEREAARLAAQAEAHRIAAEMEAQRLAEEAEARRRAEEAEARRLAEIEAARIAAEAEAARVAAEAEAQRIAAELEARRLAEEAEARRLAEEAEAKRLAEEAEARRVAEETEARRLAEIEAARIAAEAEAARVAAEAEAQRIAAELEAQRLAEEAEAKRLAEEAEARRLAEEAEARRVAEEAEARRLAEIEAARIAAEVEAARVAAEAEAQRIAAELEARRLAEEAEAKRLAEEAEARRVAEEAEARRLAEIEAARIAAEVEAARVAAEAEAQRIAAEAEAQRIAEEAEAARVAREAEETDASRRAGALAPATPAAPPVHRSGVLGLVSQTLRGFFTAPDRPALPPPKTNLDLAQAYIEALAGDPAQASTMLAPDASIQTFRGPHQTPLALVLDPSRHPLSHPPGRLRVVTLTGGGSLAAMEIEWAPEDSPADAFRGAVFVRIRDGRLVAQHSYVGMKRCAHADKGGSPSTRPALHESQRSNFETARELLADLDRGASSSEIERFYAEGAEFIDAREGSRLRLNQWLALRGGRADIATETHDLRSATGSGEEVAIELIHSRTPEAGPIVRTRQALFLTFRGGRIARQRSYACDEPSEAP